jgi:hypothetical protein
LAAFWESVRFLRGIRPDVRENYGLGGSRENGQSVHLGETAARRGKGGGLRRPFYDLHAAREKAFAEARAKLLPIALQLYVGI